MGKIKEFTWLNIDETPKSPGIYTWYLNINFGKTDIVYEDDWLDEVNQLIKQHQRPPMETSAKAHFGLKFSGQIKQVSPTQKAIRERDFSDNFQRESVSEILHKVTPYFSSPLYIGIATKSLRTRLLDHKSLIKRARDEKMSFDDDTFEEADKNFARRIVSNAIDVNNLVIYTLEVNVDKDNEKILRNAEYIINRLYYPVLGKR